MYEFISAIFVTLVVVISANEDLLEAIACGNLEQVKIILQKPDMEKGISNRNRISKALLRALELDPFDEKAEAVVIAIIEAGADPNAATYTDGGTALHKACLHGSINVVNELLKRNANIEAYHPKYGRPLNVAIEKKHTELALFLIKNEYHKPDLEAKEVAFDETALHQACEYQNVAVINALLDAEVNLEAVNKRGKTAMHIAAVMGNVEILTILKNRGAKVNFESRTSPLHKAVQIRNLEAAKVLIETLGADIDAADEVGKSALHYATFKEDIEMMKMLIAHNADPDKRDVENISPNDMALKIWNASIPELLEFE